MYPAEQPTMAERITAHGITATAERVAAPEDGEWAEADMPGARHWTVTLARPHTTETLTVPFHQGSAHTAEPTAAEVLSCLTSDASSYEDARSFEDWAEELGMNTDSRKAEADWREVGELTGKLRTFLGDHYSAFVYDTEPE